MNAIVRTVEVGVLPSDAFKIFTDEIDAWYVHGPYSWNDPERAVGIRFEPWAGGRWIEVWDEARGEGYASAVKLDLLNAASQLSDLKAPPGNRLEALKGDLKGFHSIRVNDQWRVVFRWLSGEAHDVRVEDYQ